MTHALLTWFYQNVWGNLVASMITGTLAVIVAHKKFFAEHKRSLAALTQSHLQTQRLVIQLHQMQQRQMQQHDKPTEQS